MSIYKYDEFDIRNGMSDTDGFVGLDATVFVSDGGYFKGTVAEHGTLIIRGGRADVVIENHGRVLTHGGVLSAVVRRDGNLTIHEGVIYVKEEGGYVKTSASADVTFEPSVIENQVINNYITIHQNTMALNCRVATTGTVLVHRNGVFAGTDQRLVPIDGRMICDGVLHHVAVMPHGEVACTGAQIVHHCLVHGGTLKIDSANYARSIIVQRGLLHVGAYAVVGNVTLEERGRVRMCHHSKVDFRKKLGDIEWYTAIPEKTTRKNKY